MRLAQARACLLGAMGRRPESDAFPGAPDAWRSRLLGDWQINVGHPDYRALSAEARPWLRCLAMLLSNEVVSRTFPQPGLGAILEELIGLLAALERSGASGSRSREG